MKLKATIGEFHTSFGILKDNRWGSSFHRPAVVRDCSSFHHLSNLDVSTKTDVLASQDREWRSHLWFVFCHLDFNSGSTYTRWGHASCPSSADIVYKGSMAGSRWTHKGDGANHLCLPFDPEYVPGVGGVGGYIYGSEYRGANAINSGKRNIEHRNIPCSVCRVQMRSTATMVPAHNSCPGGWIREYHGFVMAAQWTYQKTNYICMDREMKTLPGHAGDQSGNELFGIATQCGVGLDCPPYQAEKPLTCAVCTM